VAIEERPETAHHGPELERLGRAVANVDQGPVEGDGAQSHDHPVVLPHCHAIAPPYPVSATLSVADPIEGHGGSALRAIPLEYLSRLGSLPPTLIAD
jgi:hypothetical protein